MNKVAINDYLSYIPASDNPLSSDMIILKVQEKIIIFDVGNNPENVDFINNLSTPVIVVLSHFHVDHIGNLKLIDPQKVSSVYVSKQTSKYVPKDFNVNIISDSDEELLELSDQIKIKICNVPSSHSKGCLCMIVSNEYAIMGDSTYCAGKDERYFFNAGKLKEEIDFFEKELADVEWCLLSHDRKIKRSTPVVLRNLKKVYSGRDNKCPFIYLN